MHHRMPALFVGHGNPMNAIERNAYTEGWSALAEAMPRPRAILAVSAHWYAPGTAVTAMDRPRTIHDFGGFPPDLYRVQYPASGDPDLAQGVRNLLAPVPVLLDQGWGLDHGTWSVLVHMFPEANVPVVQLRIDETQPGPFHLDLGRRLAPLRD
ncbi:MAG TPA: 4,5-DOPA dioxygenase extradiol, partial [Candidatus Eisenbacteria bacterium]|nr:4,5-DOPA dioxygenase extradiol [Candidatus Eisenbacteria bacterium]